MRKKQSVLCVAGAVALHVLGPAHGAWAERRLPYRLAVPVGCSADAAIDSCVALATSVGAELHAARRSSTADASQRGAALAATQAPRPLTGCAGRREAGAAGNRADDCAAALCDTAAGHYVQAGDTAHENGVSLDKAQAVLDAALRCVELS